MTPVPCRFCAAPLEEVVVDLGATPLANSYLRREQLDSPEPSFPLCLRRCTRCQLLQLPEIESATEIFSDYAYFSSYSESWLRHAERYCEMARRRFALGPSSQVLEIASNDGYLLQYFQRAGIPVLGIEPAANVAAVARDKGITTRVAFFGRALAEELVAEGKRADLIVANNVLAHTPELNDFVAGLHIALADGGVATLEFPHLLRLLDEVQFDTIYHEHFSYFWLQTVQRIFAHHSLRVFDVEEIPTHGGSLRIYACRDDAPQEVAARVEELAQREADFGAAAAATYQRFARQVLEVRDALRRFLAAEQRAGRSTLAYGAPAKGNTLLNFCGIGSEDIAFTVDRSPHKQGLFLPGTHLPIRDPEELLAAKPDNVLILPWNLRTEIAAQLEEIRGWGGRFVTAVPRVEVF